MAMFLKMQVPVETRGIGSLELEVETVVSCHGYWESNLGPLKSSKCPND